MWTLARSLPIATLGIVLLAPPARAGLRGEVIEYGETTAEAEHPAVETQDDHSLTPRTNVEGLHYVSRTTNLEAQLCLRFGVTIRLIPDPGVPLPQQVIVVATHPKLTRPDQVSSTEDSFPTAVNGDTVFAGWSFVYRWELQPGDWTLSFRAAGQVLASQTFHISVPKPIGSICTPPPIS